MLGEPEGGDAADASTRPEVLYAKLVEMRTAYQAALVSGVEARRLHDAEMATLRAKHEARTALFTPDTEPLERFEAAWRDHGVTWVVAVPKEHMRKALQDPVQAWSVAVARCEHQLNQYSAEREAWQNKRRLVRRPPEPKLSTAFGVDLTVLRAIAERQRQAAAAVDLSALDQQIASKTVDFDAAAAQRDEALERDMGSRLASIRMGIELLGGGGSPWPEALERPELSEAHAAATRLGQMTSGLPSSYAVEVPCVIGFPAGRSLAIRAAGGDRDAGLSLLRSVVLRVLGDMPPGKLELFMMDPSGLGQTFADFSQLGDYDERLIDAGIKTSTHAIERCLDEQVAHVHTVIAKYLRGQFEDIHAYNRFAGEVAEPYRLVAIADYPRQFSDRASEQLLSLVENGPRCGVFVVLLNSPEDEAPRSVPHERLMQSMDVVSLRAGSGFLHLVGSSQEIAFLPDRCPEIAFDPAGRPSSGAARLIDRIGRAAKDTGETAITLERFLSILARNRSGIVPDYEEGAGPLSADPASWWCTTGQELTVAPIGRSGAQGVASMYFSSTTVAGGAIVVGLPRSGKTTALHAMILTMAMLYSPAELELFLIDAKHGVEFKIYSDLPHARMVSIHSEREFSVAVLKSLQAEIRQRAELFKAEGAGASNLTEFRARTGKPLSRIVVIIDEFHELFEEADAIGAEAFAAFSDIVRMGPFSGVHVVVASQTLSSMPAMDRQTLTLLPQRVAFMCNDYDADIVMGDNNKAVRLLAQTGEGLFNPSRGEESRNQPFRGLYVPPEERHQLLSALSRKASEVGFDRRPRVFDGDAVIERPPMAAQPLSTSRFTFAVGEPFSLADSEAVSLPRARGANLLLLGGAAEDGPADPALRGVVDSLLLSCQLHAAEATVIDFLGDDETPGSVPLIDVSDRTGAQYRRASRLRATIADLLAETATRTEAGMYRERTHIVCLYGLQRALDLRPYDPYSDEDDGEPSLSRMLSQLVASGPEVGIHVVMHADRSRSIELRVGSEILQEFTTRVCGSGGDQRDLSLISGGYSDPGPVRYGQLAIGDLTRGTAKRIRGYKPLADITSTPTEQPDA